MLLVRYGLTFIRYALHRLWDLPGPPARPLLRGHNVARDFDQALDRLDSAIKKRIRCVAFRGLAGGGGWVGGFVRGSGGRRSRARA